MTEHYLVVSLDGKSTSKRPYPITSTPIHLGRLQKNEIVIDEPWVSRVQCRISARPDGVMIEGEKAFLKENDEKVTGAFLKPGEHVDFHKIRFHLLRTTYSEQDRIGRYDILDGLGGGGMGKVFLARDTIDESLVALKVLNPELIKDPQFIIRFMEREFKAMKRLDHHSIVKATDAGIDQGVYFIVQEYVRGESLSSILDKHALPISKGINIVRPLAEAIDFAHSQGIIHRDLKSDNVMLDLEGLPRLLDFGLAKIADATRMTHSGMAMGTLPYMSPEQVDGEASNATDIYGLGVVLYQVLVRRGPFDVVKTGSQSMLLRKILLEKPEPPSTINAMVPPEIDQICLRCLEKDPLKRFQSARELLEALEKCRGSIP